MKLLFFLGRVLLAGIVLVLMFTVLGSLLYRLAENHLYGNRSLDVAAKVALMCLVAIITFIPIKIVMARIVKLEMKIRAEHDVYAVGGYTGQVGLGGNVNLTANGSTTSERRAGTALLWAYIALALLGYGVPGFEAFQIDLSFRTISWFWPADAISMGNTVFASSIGGLDLSFIEILQGAGDLIPW